MTLLLGDSLERLKELPDNSVDACVCDPPYGLAFMNKKWDYDVPKVELWREVYRVLKPGGHLLSFGGTRTYHRMTVNIEDAGFEIRDQIMWIYGSGFPKSTNVALRIDKESGAIKDRGGVKMKMGHGDSGITKPSTGSEAFPIYESKSDSAKQWQGWGTALKPAVEPIVMARKPLEKSLTVAANVLKHGTGAINVDASRIGSVGGGQNGKSGDKPGSGWNIKAIPKATTPQGRWPANVLLGCDCTAFMESDDDSFHYDTCAVKMLDEQSGNLAGRGSSLKAELRNAIDSGEMFSGFKNRGVQKQENNGGGASRFFYVAKASKRERLGSKHPTIKPQKLLRYLVKMVCPPGGTVLDPFMGSGTTGVACAIEGFNFIGIDREEEYFNDAKRRIEHWSNEKDEPENPDDANQIEMPLEGA